MSQYKNIVTDFKDLRKVIGEITKKTPAKSRYQQQAERMGSKEASVPFVKQKGKATSRYSAKVSGGQEKVAGPKEIKKAYIKIGRSAQGPMKKQMAIVAKELEKMGYKTYDPIAMKKMFEAIAEKMNYKEAKQTPWEFMQDVVKKKSAMKYGSVTVDMFTASAIVNAYKKVNNANKKKIEKGTINQLISLSQKVMGLSSDKKWEEPLKGFPYNEVAKALQTEAYSKNSKSGTEVAKMMMKSKTMKDFAAKVKKMKTVTADQLDKMLPDYVSGGDIGAMFEEITESKMGDLLIDIQQGATAKELSKYHNISIQTAKNFLSDYYGNKKTRTAPGLKKEEVQEGKYTEYSDLLMMKARIIAKEGPKSNKLPAMNNAIKIAMKKLGVKEEVEEANDKTAFVKRVKDRFPATDSYQTRVFKKNNWWNRIVQVVKPKNAISSKRYVELGKIFDTGNFANLEKALRDMEKKDGIKEENVQEGTWAIPKTSKEKKLLKDLMKKPIPLGKDGDSAIERIASLIGDDSLLDDLDSAGKKNPNTDARPIIKKAMKRLGIKEETDLTEVSISNVGIENDFPKVWAQKDKRMNSILKALVNLHGFIDNLKSYKKNPKSFVDSLKRIGKNDASLKKAGLTKREIGETESRSERVKEEHEHAKQSPFKLKSQQYPRAVAIDADGYGRRHATVEDIVSACDSFGMIIDKELQVEQIQKQLGKKGFISYKNSELQDVFEGRETERLILALESTVEDQEPIEYVQGEIAYAKLHEHEIEFLKPNGTKSKGPILKMSGNTFNVKDKHTGKSFTYKYSKVNEEENVSYEKSWTKPGEGHLSFKELSEAKFSPALIKKAIAIANSKEFKQGNYSGAQKAIEKLKKGLSDDPKVSDALRIANEEIDEWVSKGGTRRRVKERDQRKDNKLKEWEDAAEASGDKAAYQKFFKAALKKFGVSSPAELSGDKEKEFYNYVDKNWKADHEEEVNVHTSYKVDGRRKNFREKMRKLGYIKSQF